MAHVGLFSLQFSREVRDLEDIPLFAAGRAD